MIKFEIEIIHPGGYQTRHVIDDDCLLGRGSNCAVTLRGWRVGRTHARLFATPSGVLVEDLGAFGGTLVNGERIQHYGPLLESDVVTIGAYQVRVLAGTLAGAMSGAQSGAMTAPASASIYGAASGTASTPARGAAPGASGTASASGDETSPRPPKLNLMTRAEPSPPQPSNAAPGSHPGQAQTGAVTAGHRGEQAAEGQAAAMSEAVAVLRPQRQGPAPDATPPVPAAASPGQAAMRVAAQAGVAGPHPLEYQWRKRIHEKLIATMDARRSDVSRMSDEVLRAQASSLIEEIMREMSGIPAVLDRDQLHRSVLNEAIGLGPLEELLADDTVTEIMVNRHDEIFVEREGRITRSGLAFTDDRAVLGVIERIVAPIGRRIDESSPMVDARLKDGSRVNAIIPPLAIKGPAITIRKFSRHKLGAHDLVSYGSLSPAMADFLQICVLHRRNIVISGGTGSGKTTLLNILSNFIPTSERIITIEDAAELNLDHPHLVSLETRPPNMEGRGLVTIRDLVRNALRMRPDRIVVGECRGSEALDMLQAMNTGHEGSLTTLHANTPRDALSRLETMVLMGNVELPLNAIREQIASAVDIVVQQSRQPCGRRIVTSIVEVSRVEGERIVMQELFRFVPRGHDEDGRVVGDFSGCDMVPSFYEQLMGSGHALDVGIFRRPVSAHDAGAERLRLQREQERGAARMMPADDLSYRAAGGRE